MLNFLCRWFKPPKPMSRIEAIEVARRDTLGNFRYREQPYPWPDASSTTLHFPELVLRVDRFTLGYIERCTVYQDTHEARIGHVATGSEFVGIGLGTLLARSYISELQRRYGVTRVIFEEDSTKYNTAPYPQFFASLGAREIFHPGWRSSWELDIGTPLESNLLICKGQISSGHSKMPRP